MYQHDRLPPNHLCKLTIDPVHSGKIFKLQNMCNGSGVLAVFNLDEENQAVTGTISPKDVDGLAGSVSPKDVDSLTGAASSEGVESISEEFAVYEYFTRELKIMKADEAFELKLADSDDYKLYIMVPLKDGCGTIGRIDKFMAPATVRYSRDGEAELVEDGPYAYVENRQLVIAG